MKGSKEPWFETKVFQSNSNFVRRTAAVRSIVGLSLPGGKIPANDGMGGGFSTLTPQPTKIRQERLVARIVKRTYHDVRELPVGRCVHQNS